MIRAPRFTGSTRAMRGAALGTAAVLITTLGHSAAHGSLPEAGLLVLLLPVAWALGTLVAQKKRSAAWVLGFVLALQVLFHLLLTIAAGHGHHGSFIPDAPMLVSHLVAAGAVAAVLTHGDALVHRWIAFWQALAVELGWTPAPRPLAVTPFFTEPTLVESLALSYAIARRGPPTS